ncbi:hypothetical protein ABZ749_34740 [Micromonospora sp. NPDC047753]|uniref:hypothetical protein n=1 Tax=Micromonospora sp. NPDC047753 TaxID=3154817 RepID=UPI0033C6C5E1
MQLAQARGAEAYATGGPTSMRVIESLGAVPIDYTTSKVEEYVERHTGGEGFDMVVATGRGGGRVRRG